MKEEKNSSRIIKPTEFSKEACWERRRTYKSNMEKYLAEKKTKDSQNKKDSSKQ